MLTNALIRGMLLEESALHLLRCSGYTPVTGVGNDPTLLQRSAGLCVKGRGENHQIDAIGDYRVQQPFTNPSRLLLEAKFKNKSAGIGIVRNAVGVLKDVSEHWATGGPCARLPRYHYQYAILASSGFTAPAQRYAVAQDVYLIPFEKNRFFQPVLQAIRRVTAQDVDVATTDGEEDADEGTPLARLRRRVRSALQDSYDQRVLAYEGTLFTEHIRAVLDAVLRLRFSLLAVAMGRIPLVLTPAGGVDIADFEGVIDVRIYWNDEGWWLTKPPHGEGDVLFSFDLPRALFNHYAEQNNLSSVRALDLKENELALIDAVIVEGNTIRLVRFRLQPGWIETLRRRHRDERSDNTP